MTSYVFESECDLRDPKWSSEAAEATVASLDDSGLYSLKFRLEWVENARCATDFELKYWESGRFEQRSARVKQNNDDDDNGDREISLELRAVESCTQYNYVITASRESPYAEDTKQGTFKTECGSPPPPPPPNLSTVNPTISDMVKILVEQNALCVTGCKLIPLVRSIFVGHNSGPYNWELLCSEQEGGEKAAQNGRRGGGGGEG